MQFIFRAYKRNLTQCLGFYSKLNKCQVSLSLQTHAHHLNMLRNPKLCSQLCVVTVGELMSGSHGHLTSLFICSIRSICMQSVYIVTSMHTCFGFICSLASQWHIALIPLCLSIRLVQKQITSKYKRQRRHLPPSKPATQTC